MCLREATSSSTHYVPTIEGGKTHDSYVFHGLCDVTTKYTTCDELVGVLISEFCCSPNYKLSMVINARGIDAHLYHRAITLSLLVCSVSVNQTMQYIAPPHTTVNTQTDYVTNLKSLQKPLGM